MSVRGSTLISIVLVAAGCGEDSSRSSTSVFGAAASERGRAIPAGQEPARAVEPQRPPPPVMPIDGQTFVEGEHARDPFRPYEPVVICGGLGEDDDPPEVRLSRYPLDALRLQAVARGADGLYAMVVDPSGAGTVVQPGMYVAHYEQLNDESTGAAWRVNWRVARIAPARFSTRAGVLEETPAQVVFERPDPFSPTTQVTERVLSATTGDAR